MTWASRSLAGTVSRTRRFLTNQLWAWPIIAVVILAVIGWLVNGAIEATMKESLESELQTVLKIEVAMLENWLDAQEDNAKSMAGENEVRQLVMALVEGVDGEEEPLTAEEATTRLHRLLKPEMNSYDYEQFVVLDRHRVVASSRASAVGLATPPGLNDLTERVFAGKASVSRPFKSLLTQIDAKGRLQAAGAPTMFVLAPVLDTQLQVIAAIGFKIRPEAEFTRILQLGQLDQSGETYAFDSNGLMLSNSRFDDDLKLDGLLPEDASSILHLLVRDPGGDITKGFRPDRLRSKLPSTRMVASAVEGESGIDVAGYRDYRGVPVVGAWTWLDDYGFGVATELDYQEAFRPLTILKRTFWGLLILLAICSLAIFVFTLMMARLQRQAREAAIEAKQLGQYQLEEKLGEGAMGVVYRGRHAMLRRPTAVKLLNADKVSDESVKRFEREVQVTSHLNHPNTVAIYDYGHTPEGVFYYAMEYLDGVDLQALVNAYGPQPPGRVIYILKQVCGSLYEAHRSGLVHRDIKPANLMINRRGGEGDVVKVLDFGLVKAREETQDATMAGTPLYMSPEAITLPGSVDACSDLYAVGAVGYYLLTGRPVFEAEKLVDLCEMHTSQEPTTPSERLGRPVPEDLENVILACLEKSRSRRPQTARELANRLRACEAASEWTADKADNWWNSHERGAKTSVGASTTSQEHDATVLLDS